MKIKALWLLSPIWISSMLTVKEVDILPISEFQLLMTISDTHYDNFFWDYSKCTNTDTAWTDSIICPIESIVILEGRQTAASCSHFPSPQWPISYVIVLPTPTKMMILMDHWYGSVVPPIHTGSDSISLYPTLWSWGPLSQSFYGCPHLHLHLLYWLSHLITFSSPLLGAKFVSHLLQIYHTSWLFTLDLPFNSLLFTNLLILNSSWLYALPHDVWVLAWKSRPRHRGSWFNIFRFIPVMIFDSSAKFAKEITKERTLRAQMQLIHVLTKLQSKQNESLHALKSGIDPLLQSFNKLYTLLNYSINTQISNN